MPTPASFSYFIQQPILEQYKTEPIIEDSTKEILFDNDNEDTAKLSQLLQTIDEKDQTILELMMDRNRIQAKHSELWTVFINAQRKCLGKLESYKQVLSTIMPHNEELKDELRLEPYLIEMEHELLKDCSLSAQNICLLEEEKMRIEDLEIAKLRDRITHLETVLYFQAKKSSKETEEINPLSTKKAVLDPVLEYFYQKNCQLRSIIASRNAEKDSQNDEELEPYFLHFKSSNNQMLIDALLEMHKNYTKSKENQSSEKLSEFVDFFEAQCTFLQTIKQSFNDDQLAMLISNRKKILKRFYLSKKKVHDVECQTVIDTQSQLVQAFPDAQDIQLQTEFDSSDVGVQTRPVGFEYSYSGKADPKVHHNTDSQTEIDSNEASTQTPVGGIQYLNNNSRVQSTCHNTEMQTDDTLVANKQSQTPISSFYFNHDHNESERVRLKVRNSSSQTGKKYVTEEDFIEKEAVTKHSLVSSSTQYEIVKTTFGNTLSVIDFDPFLPKLKFSPVMQIDMNWESSIQKSSSTQCENANPNLGTFSQTSIEFKPIIKIESKKVHQINSLPKSCQTSYQYHNRSTNQSSKFKHDVIFDNLYKLKQHSEESHELCRSIAIAFTDLKTETISPDLINQQNSIEKEWKNLEEDLLLAYHSLEASTQTLSLHL